MTDSLFRVDGKFCKRAKTTGELASVTTAFGEGQHSLEGQTIFWVGFECLRQQPLGLVGLREATAIQLSGFCPESGATHGVFDDRSRFFAGIGKFRRFAGRAEIRKQLVERDGIGRLECEGLLEMFTVTCRFT